MKLWHQHLIHYLNDKLLLKQHDDCCRLRGRWWKKKNDSINYIFKYDLAHLYEYHIIVISEMTARHYDFDAQWYSRRYRGITLGYAPNMSEIGVFKYNTFIGPKSFNCIYVEHDDDYLRECLKDLLSENSELVNGKHIESMLLDLDLKFPSKN